MHPLAFSKTDLCMAFYIVARLRANIACYYKLAVKRLNAMSF